MASSPVIQEQLRKIDAIYEAAIKATLSFCDITSKPVPLQSAHILAGVASVKLETSTKVFTAKRRRSFVIGGNA